MEGAWTDEVTDAGIEFVRDAGFWEDVSLLFGDIDLSVFGELPDNPDDYIAIEQEASLAQYYTD